MTKQEALQAIKDYLENIGDVHDIADVYEYIFNVQTKVLNDGIVVIDELDDKFL